MPPRRGPSRRESRGGRRARGQYSGRVSAIEVSGLKKSYGRREVLHGVSFRVEPGEVVALLGPNGAGKTTTVEILEGYRERDGGEVLVLGLDPAKGGSELRARIGIVLQSSAVYPLLSVHELLELFAGYYERARGVDEVIELVGLDGKSEARVRTLSGGQLRRLDLALALVGDPELIFLDEPTTGFDPAARRTAWGVVRALKDLGKTVLLTTHYLDEAQTLADRVAIVKDGVIVAEGPPAELGVGGERYRVAYDNGDGRRVELETDNPTELLHRLTSEAISEGRRLEGLTVARPTLEEVYLELTEEASSE
jgi:ABC-2 type transport system ATP-binding protein